MAKVLVIDDDANNRLLLATLIEHAGHVPLEAASGIDGLQAVAAELPDAVIVDLSLPDLPGAEVIRRLRSDAQTATIPIALYTATQFAPALDELIETYDIRSIVPKPGDPQQILAAVHRLVNVTG